MSTVVDTTGAPFCPLPGLDLRRGYVRAENTDIARTIREYSPPRVRNLALLDDYDRTDALAHLDAPGAFRP